MMAPEEEGRWAGEDSENERPPPPGPGVVPGGAPLL